jgi:predicted metalloprotease with PDZ domain
MRNLGAFLVVTMLATAPAMAGDKGKCDGDPADCAKKMEQKLSQKAWLGIDYDTDEKGRWVVTGVEPGSPAQKAGFEKGDVMLAIDGVGYTKENKAEVKAVYASLKPGSEATYVVSRKGGKVKLKATLGHVPEELQKKWIAEHMSQQHSETQMASKEK